MCGLVAVFRIRVLGYRPHPAGDIPKGQPDNDRTGLWLRDTPNEGTLSL